MFGASLVPVRHFHIPAVILGAGIEPRRDERLISQIDLAPTLLSLTGVDTEHPMIGHDLTRSTPGRAIMQYDNTYGYLKEDRLLVMAPSKTPVQYRYTAPGLHARGAGSRAGARGTGARAVAELGLRRPLCPARPGRAANPSDQPVCPGRANSRRARSEAAWQWQPGSWSLTMPTDCMKA